MLDVRNRGEYQPSLTKDQCALFLRQAGYPTIDAFAQELVSYRGGMLVSTTGMTNSQIASHMGIEQAIVDSLMASRDFALLLREQITRSIVSPQEQGVIARSLLDKTKTTTDIRQMVAGLKHLDEMAGLGPHQQQHQPKTLIVRYEEDRVNSPYEDYQDPLDAEFQLVDSEGETDGDVARGRRQSRLGQDSREDDYQDQEAERENSHQEGRQVQSTPRDAGIPRWKPARTNEIDVGSYGERERSPGEEDEEAQKRKASGLATVEQGDSQTYSLSEWEDE